MCIDTESIRFVGGGGGIVRYVPYCSVLKTRFKRGKQFITNDITHTHTNDKHTLFLLMFNETNGKSILIDVRRTTPNSLLKVLIGKKYVEVNYFLYCSALHFNNINSILEMGRIPAN